MPVELLTRYNPEWEDDSAVHHFAREARLFMRAMTFGLMIVTVITMITFWFWAVLPAVLLLISAGVWWMTAEIESRGRTRREQLARAKAIGPNAAVVEPVEGIPAQVIARDELDEPIPPKVVDDEVPIRLLRHQSILIAAGVIAALVVAAIMAAILFGGEMMLYALPFIFACIAMFSAPFWVAAIDDSMVDGARRDGGITSADNEFGEFSETAATPAGPA